jgi:predicted nuclease of predicted toxin-antitoxin system
MVRFLSDINFNHKILNGVFTQSPGIDLARAQDLALDGIDDPEVLARAAEEDRLLITHDVRTMSHFAGRRLAAGEPMSGVLIFPNDLSIRTAIDNIILIHECSEQHEWYGVILHVTE